MRFAFEVKIFGKRFGKRDIGDGVVISQIAERRLQRVGVVVGFDNYIGILFVGQRFDFFIYISVDGVKVEIRVVATGNIIAMGDRIDVNYYRSVSAFSQLDGNLIDCVKFYYYYKIFYAYVGIAYVVYGKLRRVVVDGVFLGVVLRYFAQFVVIYCVNDDRFGERVVVVYVVVYRVVGNVVVVFDNVVNYYVVKLEFVKFNVARRICRTRSEYLLFVVKVFINKRVGGAEVDYFRFVFRCVETYADFYFIS